MALKQEVILTIEDENGTLVLDATGLRVDFDVRFIDQFSRATFKIWNLNDATIKAIMVGDKFVTLKTKLHGRNEFTIANKYYISNSVDEKILPNTITTLFCFDKLERDLFEFELEGGVTVNAPCSLERAVTAIFSAAGYSTAPTYLYFPDDLTTLVSNRRSATYDGSVGDALAELAEEFKFKTYIENGLVTLMCTPDLNNVNRTNLPQAPVITLQTDMMRANPKVGPAILNVTSNLDSRLRPGAILDISKLLTVGVNVNETSAQLADNFFAEGITGFSKYQILDVQHKGSNYTGDWFSEVTASSPTVGEVASVINWLNQ